MTNAEAFDNFVRAAYITYLQRDPDLPGLQLWTAKTRREGPRATILGILTSDEYKNKYPNKTEFVRSLYNNLLGREPDSPGLAFWVTKLESGAKRSSIIKGFLGSQEYKQRVSGASGPSGATGAMSLAAAPPDSRSPWERARDYIIERVVEWAVKKLIELFEWAHETIFGSGGHNGEQSNDGVAFTGEGGGGRFDRGIA